MGRVGMDQGWGDRGEVVGVGQWVERGEGQVAGNVMSYISDMGRDEGVEMQVGQLPQKDSPEDLRGDIEQGIGLRLGKTEKGRNDVGTGVTQG